MTGTNKSLGQHWLRDRETLIRIADEAGLKDGDTVLEIGPGQGTLTSVLLKKAERVVAVEFDTDLARKLPGQFPGKNLEVVNQDILTFDLTTLPKGYKVVANVPYYITGKIVNTLLTSRNKPSVVVLLVQKEVAERLAAEAGRLSILGISAQVFSKVSLGDIVSAEKFTPPPKVDSMVVRMEVYERNLVEDLDEREFFRMVKVGFSAPRKKLIRNLEAGLGVDREKMRKVFGKNGLDDNIRPQEMSIDDWRKLYVDLMK